MWEVLSTLSWAFLFHYPFICVAVPRAKKLEARFILFFQLKS